MSDDLLTTIVFEVDANNVKTGITSIKRSISDLGKAVKEVAENTSAELDKITVKDGASSIEKATAKTSKAVIKQTGELQKAIATFGSTASTGLKSAYESIEKAQVRLSGIDPSILNPYIAALKDVRALSGYAAEQQAKAAQAAEKAALEEARQIEHTLSLKQQIVTANKVIADKQAASLREELALVNSINEAALNRKYGGSAKSSAYYQEKAGTTASPDVSNALANLRAQEQAQLALNRAAAAKAAIDDKAAKDLREQTAAFTAFRTEVQNAELNLVHFGRAKSAAMLADKGARLGFDPAAIQAELAALQKIEAANKAAFSAANPHLATLAKQAEAAGTSVKGLNANLRQVPAQFTDIIVSLQGGQNPLTVLLQQGGQLKDLFGGVGNAARALGSYIYGLINPYTIAAGVVTSLAVAYTQGAAESEAFNKALITTGNAAGVTSAQLANMAKSVSKTTGGTIGSAADSLAQLAGASGIASSQFESIAATAVMMEKVTGVAVADTVKQFAELGKDPVKASEDLNKSMHYLTGAVYEQIKALRDQGDAVGAAALAQKTYDDALKERIPQLAANLGLLEKAWKGIIGASKSAWDAMLNVGREDTLKSQIDKLQEKMASRKSSADYNPMAAAAQERVDKAQLEYMQRMLASQGAMAVYQKDSAKQEEAKIALSAQAEKSASKQVIMQRELNKAKEQYANIKNPTEKDTENYAAVVAKIAKDNTEAAKSVRAKKEAITDAAKGQKLYNDLLDTGAGLTANFAEQWGLLSAKFAKDNNMDELLKGQELLLAKQPAMLAVKKEQLDAEKELSKAIESANKERQKDIDTATKAAATLTDQIRAQQDHNASIGMTAEAIAQLTAQRELDKASALEGIAIKELDRNLDYQKYEATMAQVKAMRDLAKEKATGGTLETAHKLANDLAKENKKAAEESSKYWEDALMRAFESGKGFFQSLWDTIKNTLKTQVLKVSLQAIGIGGAAGGAAAADVSNIFSTAGNASSMGSMFASAFPTAAATISTVGNAALAGIQSMIGMTGTAAQAATAAANGIAYATTGAASTAASAGSMIAAAGPYVAAAMGIYAIHQATQGETRSGGEYRSNITDGAKYAYGPGGGDSAASQVKLAIDTTTAAINATLKQVGSAATLVGFAAGYETSGRNRGGAYAGGTLSTGVRIGQDGSGDNYAGTKYDPTKGFNQDAKGAVAALDLELKQSIIETLQAAADVPKTIAGIIDNSLAKANVTAVAQLSAEATESVLSTINAVVTSVTAFNDVAKTLPFVELRDLGFDAAAGLISAAGGLDKLGSNLTSYYEHFYTAEEKRNQTIKNLSIGINGTDQPIAGGFDVTKMTREQFRELAQSLDLTDEAGQKAYASLMSVEGAFFEFTKTNNEWQIKLDLATGKTTQRELDKIAALESADGATRALIESYYALADPAITQAIVDAQNEVAIATNKTTQLELDRAAALAGANESTRPLVNALYDLKAAAAAAATLTAVKEKYTAPLTVAQASATLPTGIGSKLMGMDSAGFRAAIQQYADDLTQLGADGYAGSQQLQSFTAALDIMLASIEAAEAVTKSLADESKNLAAQLLKAKGDMSGYRAASTAIATAGYTPAQTAAYTDNATTTTAIGLLDAFKPVLTPEAALAALPSNLASNVAGQSSAAIAEYVTSLTTTLYDSLKTATTAQKPGIQARLNELMDFTDEMKIVGAENDRVAKEIADAAIAAAKKASEEYAAITKGLETESKNLNIALLEAQGNFTGAKDAARTLAIEGMDALQIAMWDTNAAVKATTASLTTQTSLREKYAQPMTTASAKSALPADLQTSLSTSTDPRATIVAYAASLDTSTVAGQNAIESLGKLTGALDFLVSASDTAKAALKDLTGQTDTENATRGMTELEKSIYAVRVKMSEMTTNLGLDGTLTADEKTAIENYGIAMMTTLIEAANTKAADIMAGVNTEFENLGKSDLEITLAGITKKGQDFKDSIEALGNTTPATTAAIDKLTASLANNAANDVLNKFKLPETVAQATATLSTAGFDVTGLDTAGINKYFTDILTGPGMQDAAGDWTKAGLAAVTAVDKVTGSIGTLTTASDKVLAETKGLTDQLNTLRDTEAQALTRQRDALDENNRAIFDQVTAWTKFNGLLSTFIVPETTSQATATVTAAGFDVTGLDSTGIAAYVNSLLSDIKLDPTLFDPIKREFTTAGQIAVNGINGVAGSFKTLASASSDTENITKGLETEAKNLGVALLEAQGNTAGAKAATRALATEGMDALQISLWDTNTATKELTASLVKGNTESQSLQDEYDTLTMTGTQLLAKQRSALEESNWARFDEINAIKLANSERDKNQGLQGRLINATGNEAAITEWNRSLELAGDWTVAQKDMLQAIYAAEDAAKLRVVAEKAAEEARTKLEGTYKSLYDLSETNRSLIATVQKDAGDTKGMEAIAFEAKFNFLRTISDEWRATASGLWDMNVALKASVESLNVIAGMRTSFEDSEIALKRAKGDITGANLQQYTKDTKDLPFNPMTPADLLEYTSINAQKVIKANPLTVAYQTYAGAVGKLGDDLNNYSNSKLAEDPYYYYENRHLTDQTYLDFGAKGDKLNTDYQTFIGSDYAKGLIADIAALDAELLKLSGSSKSVALTLYNQTKANEAQIASINTQASIWDKFATEDQKKVRATTDLTAGFAAINTAIPATAAEFLALSQAADPATAAGRLVIDTLGGLSDAFALLHPAISATTDITKEYQRALLTAQGDTAGIAAIDKADLTATRTAAGWTPEQIKAVFDAEDVKKLSDANSAYTRALLEASGDTSGLTAFDKAVSDAALLAAGWTQVQIDAVDTATETAKIATATKDYNRALLDAAGDTTGIAAFDKAISDAAKLAAGWTQAQINAVDTATANTKATEDAKTLSDTNKGWQDQLDVLRGTRTQTQVDREKQLTAATDESTKALMRLVFAQQDYKRIVDERAGLTTQLLQIEGDTAALRAAELAKIDPLNRALQQRVWALQDEKTAQAALQSASTAITQNYITASDKLAAAQDTVNNLVKEAALQMHDFSVSISEFLRTLDTQALGDGSPESRYRALAADFRSTSAKANTGDKDAISKITGVASEFLAASKDYFATGAGFTSDTDLVRKALGDIATKTGALGAAAAASADPMVKAQSDLTKAMREMAVANNLIRESGADTALATTDLLADFRKAQTDLAAAQASAAIWKAADDAAQITRDNLQLNATTAVVSTAAAAGVTANAAVVDSPVIASINTAANTGNGYLAEIKDSAKSTESLTRATTVWLQSIHIELIELNSKNAKLNEEVTALRAKVASMESNQRLAASAPTPA